MRKLGRALGVEAMSLYNHVANKDDMLDGIVDLVLSEFELPSAGDDWSVAIRRTAISAHEALLRHPWACTLIMSRFRPARMRYIEWILARRERTQIVHEEETTKDDRENQSLSLCSLAVISLRIPWAACIQEKAYHIDP